MRTMKWFAAAGVVLALTACGGGGAEPVPGSGGGGGTTSPVAANLILQLDKTTVGNSGADQVKVTVTVTNANNNVVAGTAVSVSADADTLVIADSEKTDDKGRLTATVFVGSENRSNRTVTVKAASGSLTKDAKFEVIGAKLKATAVPSVIEPGISGKLIYQLVDVNGNPMPRQAIKVEGPNSALSGSGQTDANGSYSFSYMAPSTAGDLQFTAAAGGVSQVATVTVASSGNNVIPDVPAGAIKSASVEASPSVVTVNTASTTNQAAIRALFVGSNNAPIRNVRVRFDLAGDINNVGGSFSTGSSVVYSDSNGEATAAYIPGTRFSPTDGVTVRACYGYKDSDLANGACPNQATVKLTVVSEAISVSVGTNNLLLTNTLTYAQDFVVTVVDSAGRAKADVLITPSLDLLRFGKGQWVFDAVAKAWKLAPTQYFENGSTGALWYLEDPISSDDRALDPTGAPEISPEAACWNEDRNRNGVLEAEEDSRSIAYSKTSGGNGNSKLDPAKSDVTINVVGSDRTDANGQVVLRIEYAQNLGSWLEYKLLVSASGVAGTEGRATWTNRLQVPAAALKQETEPAFVKSRYGVEAGCNNPR